MYVSVIIPLFNKARYIGRALASVFTQTHQDFEIVVIDDGSTDGSATVVQAVTDSRLRLITQPNAGQGAARDRGMREAHGEAFALLDADDAWGPACLATLTALLEEFPAAGIAGVRYAMIESDGRIVPAQLSGGITETFHGVLPNYYACALDDPPLWSSAVIIRRQAWVAIAPRYSPARFGEDLYLWSQFANSCPVAYDGKILAFYHRGAEGRVSTTSVDQEEMPVVTYLIDEVLAGHLTEQRETLLTYLAKYQFETLYRMGQGAGALERARAIFRRTPLIRAVTADWQQYRDRLYRGHWWHYLREPRFLFETPEQYRWRLLTTLLRPVARPLEKLLTRQARHMKRRRAVTE